MCGALWRVLYWLFEAVPASPQAIAGDLFNQIVRASFLQESLRSWARKRAKTPNTSTFPLNKMRSTWPLGMSAEEGFSLLKRSWRYCTCTGCSRPSQLPPVHVRAIFYERTLTVFIVTHHLNVFLTNKFYTCICIFSQGHRGHLRQTFETVSLDDPLFSIDTLSTCMYYYGNVSRIPAIGGVGFTFTLLCSAPFLGCTHSHHPHSISPAALGRLCFKNSTILIISRTFFTPYVRARTHAHAFRPLFLFCSLSALRPIVASFACDKVHVHDTSIPDNTCV